MMKEQKGITLIALVITIIVLLILAGISIAMLTGNNGLLTKANSAKTETTKAEVMERINMELNAAYADVLSGDISDFPDTESAYIKAINKNLTVNDEVVAVATPSENKKVLTITPNDSKLGISAGTVSITDKKITPAK